MHEAAVPCGTDGCDLPARWAAGPFLFDSQVVGPYIYECGAGHITKVEPEEDNNGSVATVRA